MLTIDGLRAFGANVDEGLARCMNNEGFYLRMVGMVLNDANFEKLSQAVQAGDLDACFEASHALKGVLANLSLTPMQNLASEMCELFRSRTQMDYAPMLAQLLAKREELAAL